MNIEDLKTAHPDLWQALQWEQTALAPFLEPYGTATLYDPAYPLAFEDLRWLALCREILKIQSTVTAKQIESTQWHEVMRSTTDGESVVVFFSFTGELEELPLEFVDCFIAQERIDARLITCQTDPALVNLVQGNKIRATFPKTLLFHLIKEKRSQSNPSKKEKDQ